MYLHHVLGVLQTTRFAWIIDNKAMSLEQPDFVSGNIQDALDKGWDLLGQWLQLSMAEARAEFPTWDVVQCLRPFDVFNDHTQPGCSAPDGDIADDLKRLALPIKCDHLQLHDQYLRALRVCKWHNYFGKSENVQMWQSFIDHIFAERRAASFALWLRGLARWRGLRFTSTSGIESSFTRCLLRISDRQKAAKHNYEECLAMLVTLDEELLPEVCAAAQSSWVAMGFGVPRSSGSRKRRVDWGTERAAESDDGVVTTEAAFLRRRRAFAFDDVADVASRIDNLPGVSALDERGQGEMEFARRKAQKRKHEAHLDGLLLPEEELSEADQALAAKGRAKQLADERKRHAKQRAALQRHEGGGAPAALSRSELCAKAVYFDDGVLDVDDEYGIDPVADLQSAEVIVSKRPDVRRPTSLAHWVAVLRGLYVICPQTLEGKEGIQLRYDAALRLGREVYCAGRAQASGIREFLRSP